MKLASAWSAPAGICKILLSFYLELFVLHCPGGLGSLTFPWLTADKRRWLVQIILILDKHLERHVRTKHVSTHMHMMTNGTCIVEQRARLPPWLMMLREVGSRQVVSCYQRKWWGSGWPRIAQPSCPSLYSPHITPGVRTASQRILLMLSQWRAAVCIFTWKILPNILHGTLRAEESPWHISQPSVIQDCTTAQQKAVGATCFSFPTGSESLSWPRGCKNSCPLQSFLELVFCATSAPPEAHRI